jgi:hypothetical protein
MKHGRISKKRPYWCAFAVSLPLILSNIYEIDLANFPTRNDLHAAQSEQTNSYFDPLETFHWSSFLAKEQVISNILQNSTDIIGVNEDVVVPCGFRIAGDANCALRIGSSPEVENYEPKYLQITNPPYPGLKLDDFQFLVNLMDEQALEDEDYHPYGDGWSRDTFSKKSGFYSTSEDFLVRFDKAIKTIEPDSEEMAGSYAIPIYLLLPTNYVFGGDRFFKDVKERAAFGHDIFESSVLDCSEVEPFCLTIRGEQKSSDILKWICQTFYVKGEFGPDLFCFLVARESAGGNEVVAVTGYVASGYGAGGLDAAFWVSLPESVQGPSLAGPFLEVLQSIGLTPHIPDEFHLRRRSTHNIVLMPMG